MNPLSAAGALSSGGTNSNPFVTTTIGLQAAIAPTRTTAVSRENQAVLLIATTALPVPLASPAQALMEVISENEWRGGAL